MIRNNNINLSIVTIKDILQKCNDHRQDKEKKAFLTEDEKEVICYLHENNVLCIKERLEKCNENISKWEISRNVSITEPISKKLRKK
jgi:DNA-binding transcriptional MerR regulator